MHPVSEALISVTQTKTFHLACLLFQVEAESSSIKCETDTGEMDYEDL
jgi:hypothetical protein